MTVLLARVLACLVLAALALGGHAARAQENLSFELAEPESSSPLGWRLAVRDASETVRIGLDPTVAREGGRSLRIVRESGPGITRVTQRIPIDARSGADRIALQGYVRAAGGGASLWLRVEGSGGFLAADSRGSADTAAAAAQWALHSVQLPLPQDAREVVVGVSIRGAGSAWFDALSVERLDAAVWPSPSATARRYVNAALDVMQQHSINRRAIDWAAFRAAVLEQARGAVTAVDAHLAVRFALYGLGDRHSYLLPAPTARALSVTAVSNARTGRGSVAPQAKLVDAVGYLALPGFAGGTPVAQVAFANAVQDLIEDLDEGGAIGFVLDLRGNSGGNLWPMLAGIGPLLGSGEVGASVYPDGREVPFWYDDGKAGFGDYVQLRVSRAAYVLRNADLPVAVLTDAETASSAEVLAIAFRERPNSVLVGAPTRGLAAGNRTFALADGAALVLTVAATRDRAGRVFSGSVEPDFAVTTAPRAVGEDPPLAAALEWVRARATAD